MKFTESMLEQYAAPLSATEDQHCKNAIAMVRDALKPLGFTDDGKDIRTLYSDTYAYSLEMRSLSGNRRVKQSSPNLCVNCFRHNMQEAA